MKKVKDLLVVLIVFVLISSVIYKIAHRYTTNHLLNKGFVIVKAVVINEKNFIGNTKVSHEFTYSYEFSVNGKCFKGDTHDKGLNVGDSLDIQYVQSTPGFNRPVYIKD